ncbi:MAG: 5-(carboxyamino)imidazole ribonucleotide mutase [Candidatus Omnitrophica bacterium]|jgi:5-(carboxyamino)imidazole ribonucleotide mutase|nr:5-(carboxyamino)imidazole ribonucleotide mutase [Candidatus Omnitrophota bacterium]MDD5080538.1 5-(carboxyamino)imidazole ribonucleotide mutase [Candidatus Omnitrophota bacterium]MDD5441378.1 5-(carboxyamino)imidazole ribonucleotide mutase [Candidatus Omnitrophota bacterium]
MPKKIAVITGSKSDLPLVQEALEVYNKLDIDYSIDVISAHRHPDKLRQWCVDLGMKDTGVVIACAGMAAALPGFVASYVDIPVIGVALKGGVADGMDALLSIISTPKGMGLVCSGVGKSAMINAMITALEILALSDKDVKGKVSDIKQIYR